MDRVIENGWFNLSLAEQMVNIGLEVKRAFRFDVNPEKRNPFLDKAVEYTLLSIKDPKNSRVVPELEIAKEILEDYKAEHKLDTTKEKINGYYSYFTALVQNSPAGHRAAQPQK